MSSIKLSTGLVAGVFVCLSSGVIAEQYHLPILQYHHVDETTPVSTSVTPAQFQKHLDYLQKEGFQVIDLLSGLNALRAGNSLPDKAVAITFDDAYRNIYENGFPILKEKGFPFTVFINSDPILKSNKKFLAWDDMREMQKYGGVMANHTISHPYMLRQEKGETYSDWFERMKNEVRQVELLLVEKLGRSPKMLAYPYGESNETIRAFLKQEGIIGFGQQSGVVGVDSNFTNLPRFPASGSYADIGSLKTKLSALPMPLADIDVGGDFAGAHPVTMRLTLKSGQYRTKEFNCYVSGQGKASLEWLTPQEVKITAPKAFSYGRGRINCTMPTKKGTQYHWFSNVWVKPRAEEGYVIEKNEKY